jgi:heme exporter protein A
VSTLIDAKDVTKGYGLLPVLRGLTLSVPSGQAVALMGANGSGKSTFLRLLSGLSRPDGGALTVGGWSMPRESEQVRRHLGVVAHRPLVYEGLTARENLRFYGRLYGLTGADLEARAEAGLERVGLKRRADDVTRGFSRGMMQRLSLARALLHDPDILLFDEPFTGLDPSATALLSQIITDSRAAGKTLLMTTHDAAQAVTLCDRVVVIAKGVVSFDAPSAGLDFRDIPV